MSLSLIETELRRFLTSLDAEVICVTGRWGVGKTYAWKKILEDTECSGNLGMQRYSYVTLFGINSLEDLRFAIFENTVTGKNVVDGPNVNTFRDLFRKGDTLARRFKPIVNLGLTWLGKKDIGASLFHATFLTIRNQIICLDDLERAGRSLDVRDILGLVSFLKEVRNCKVVLLLNDEKIDEAGRVEFARQLEKVSDVNLAFDLSSEDAISIALATGSPIRNIIGPCIVDLHINNIRIIKKIERLAIRLFDILTEFDRPILDQAIATLVLASWSTQEPDIAPSLDFLRKYNRLAMRMRVENGSPDPNHQRWANVLGEYPYHSADQMDMIILDSVTSGYFDVENLRAAATLLQNQQRRNPHHNSFNKAWEELYHGSLVATDDEFLDAVYTGAMKNLNTISPPNINSTIRILREQSREDQANNLVKSYVDARSDEKLEFFNLSRHPFMRDDPIDHGLNSAFSKHIFEYTDDRDPLAVLRLVGERSGWNDEDVALLTKQSVDDFEHMLESLRGGEIEKSITMLLNMGHSQAEGAATILKVVTEALRRIARKSPLRAQKLSRFHVSLDGPEPSNPEPDAHA